MDDHSPADTVETLIATAQSLFRAKEYAQAQPFFSSARRMRPDDAHLADRYAHCYSALGQWPQAQRAWAEVLQKFGPSAGRVNHLARTHLELRDFAAAQAVLSAYRDQVEPNINTFICLAVAALGTSDIGQALEAALQVERLGKGADDTVIGMFTSQLDQMARQGHAADVLKLVELMAPLCDQHFASSLLAERRAQCFMALGRWAPARAAWEAVIASRGRTLVRVNHLARVCLEQQDFAAARALLVESRGEFNLNAEFFVSLATANLALGDADAAWETAEQAERIGQGDASPPVFSLCNRLQRLAGNGHARAVLGLLERLLGITGDPMRVLRAICDVAGLLQDWRHQVSAAEQMVAAAPDQAEGNILLIEALLAAGRTDECRRQIEAARRRFDDPPGNVPGPRVETAELVLDSHIGWRSHLESAERGEAFPELGFRVAAHMALKQFDAAIEVASLGLARHGAHPWFMILRGRCEERRGNLGAALDWLERAARSELMAPHGLLILCRLQMEAGQTENASRAAATLFQRLPHFWRARQLHEKLSGRQSASCASLAQAAPRPALARQTWLHGGDSGDLIYALPAIRGGGGGHLYLTCIELSREPMVARKIDFLIPLLAAQPYVSGVTAWQGEAITGDFIMLRGHEQRDVDLATQSWHSVLADGRPDVGTPWLSVPQSPRHGRPVFARSARYRNSKWEAFWRDLKAGSPDAIFVGTPAEYAAFGHGEHVWARDALELATIIAGASVFVGNQSLPYAIAEGLKVGRMLEVSSLVPNCIFGGALAIK